jgi:hypothetical protein
VIGLLTKLGDRLLDQLAPKASAKADTTWYEYCYCTSDWRKIYKICHTVGGISTCGPCDHVRSIGC